MTIGRVCDQIAAVVCDDALYALTANRAGAPIWTYFEPGFATLEVRQVVAVVSGNA